MRVTTMSATSATATTVQKTVHSTGPAVVMCYVLPRLSPGARSNKPVAVASRIKLASRPDLWLRRQQSEGLFHDQVLLQPRAQPDQSGAVPRRIGPAVRADPDRHAQG